VSAALARRAEATPGDAPLAPRADFPGLPPGWSYLDSAVSAQKPRAVIDAVARALGEDYAAVHRGVYKRSADMTAAYEAARSRVARFLNAGADEILFTRGATEAINLVAQSWGGANLKPGDRILLTRLEHHSNIVPWQLIAARTGAAIDVAPLTADGRIDEAALVALIRPGVTRVVAFAHVSNVLGGVADAAAICAAARAAGAVSVIDGCQAAPRRPVDVAAIGCDFYAFSAHKLYGPTGIGVLFGRRDVLEAMPPWQGGGAMIETVAFEGSTWGPPPARFEAGTPPIAEALGLAAAIDYVDAVGLDAIDAHERALAQAARAALRRHNGVRLFGPEDGAGIVSFGWEGVHPHDVATILDEAGVAIRAGHHCAQPLMAHLGVGATARASFGLYNAMDDVERLSAGLERVRRIFG
jgi:cysteine desulfurase/selenocysteine lyase